MPVEDVARWLLMFVVIPLWVLAGLADWWCHRRTDIAHTSGWPENVFHWVLLAEGGVALLAVALLEIDAAVLLLVFAAFLAHEITTWIELRYTAPLRDVQPGEQMVHSFMEILPLLVLALAAVIGWDRVAGLFEAGAPDFALALKAEPWPASYLAGLGCAVLLLNVLPLAEEGWRCARAAQRSGRAP
jgi:hypothetical protein